VLLWGGAQRARLFASVPSCLFTRPALNGGMLLRIKRIAPLPLPRPRRSALAIVCVAKRQLTPAPWEWSIAAEALAGLKRLRGGGDHQVRHRRHLNGAVRAAQRALLEHA
jgi:hypothetical protein